MQNSSYFKTKFISFTCTPASLQSRCAEFYPRTMRENGTCVRHAEVAPEKLDSQYKNWPQCDINSTCTTFQMTGEES